VLLLGSQHYTFQGSCNTVQCKVQLKHEITSLEDLTASRVDQDAGWPEKTCVCRKVSWMRGWNIVRQPTFKTRKWWYVSHCLHARSKSSRIILRKGAGLTDILKIPRPYRNSNHTVWERNTKITSKIANHATTKIGTWSHRINRMISAAHLPLSAEFGAP
jgi:hypothetical protein